MFLYSDDPSFIGTWRIFLFDAFVFVGGIVLISLLVAILSDTFDSVKYTEKAELVKCRAEMAGSALFFVARHIVHFEERSRQASTHALERQQPSRRSTTCWQKIKEATARCALNVNDSFHRLHSLKPGYRRRYFHLVPLDETGAEQTRWEGRMIQFKEDAEERDAPEV